MNTNEDFHHTGTKEFVAALGKYMKLIKVCTPDKLNSCFAGKIANNDGTETIDVSTLKTSDALNEACWRTF